VSLVVLVLLAPVLLLPWAGALVLKTPLVLLFWAVVVGAATGGLLRWWAGGPIWHELQILPFALLLIPPVYGFAVGTLTNLACRALVTPGSEAEAWLRIVSLARCSVCRR
jgi:hypothetical protein